MIISLAVIPASADNTSAYIQIQSGSVQVRFTNFTAGETYTISAKMKTSDMEANGGFAYMSWYEFVSTDTDRDVNADFEGYGANLGQWMDWATCSTDSDWTEYSHSFTFGANCGHLRVQLGFYLATGTVSVDDIVIKDAAGNVVFSEDWEDGYDSDIWDNVDDNGGTTEYVIQNYTAPVTSEDESGTGTPETGDEAAVYAVIALAVLAAAGIVTYKKVRQ